MKLRSTILDGEIVALDEEGIPRFQLLQKWQKRPTTPVVFVLFDLLWVSGRDLTGKSVIQRRERLQEIITPVDGIQVGSYLENRGIELFNLAKEKGLEGIIAKRKSSTYQPGRRSPDWLKIRHDHSKSSLCAASLKEKAVALRALERYCSVDIATTSFAIMGILEVGLARKDYRKQLSD